MPPKLGRIGRTWQLYFNADKDKAMADAEDEILTLDEVAAYLKAGTQIHYLVSPG